MTPAEQLKLTILMSRHIQGSRDGSAQTIHWITGTIAVEGPRQAAETVQRASLPLLVKIGLLQTALVFAALLVLPPATQLRPAAMPAIWAGAFCLSLSVVLLAPARRRP